MGVQLVSSRVFILTKYFPHPNLMKNLFGHMFSFQELPSPESAMGKMEHQKTTFSSVLDTFT